MTVLSNLNFFFFFFDWGPLISVRGMMKLNNDDYSPQRVTVLLNVSYPFFGHDAGTSLSVLSEDLDTGNF